MSSRLRLPLGHPGVSEWASPPAAAPADPGASSSSSSSGPAREPNVRARHSNNAVECLHEPLGCTGFGGSPSFRVSFFRPSVRPFSIQFGLLPYSFPPQLQKKKKKNERRGLKSRSHGCGMQSQHVVFIIHVQRFKRRQQCWRRRARGLKRSIDEI